MVSIVSFRQEHPMNKYIFPLAVLATMFVADYASGAGNPHGPKGGMPASSHAAANSNGIRSIDRDRGLDRAAERRNLHSTVKSNRGLHRGKNKTRLASRQPGMRSHF
jgi:hypothetical protein